MEEKGIDKNAIVGFVLIFAIMIGWFFINQPSPEEIAAQKELLAQQEQLESIADTSDTSTLTTTSVEDSEKLSPIQNTGSFAYTVASDEPVLFENEFFKAEFSRKGAQLRSLILKQHTDYKGDRIEMIQPSYSNLNLELALSSGGTLNSGDIYFEPEITRNGNQASISFKAKTSDTSYLAFVYQFRNTDYLVDFDINAVNLDGYISDKNAILNWSYTAPRNDQSIEYENRYTRLTYRLNDGTVKKLSATSDSDEQTIDKATWLSFRHHFFSAILGSKDTFESVQLSSENLVETESKSATHTKRFSSSIDLGSMVSTNNLGMYFYFGPTDSETLAQYAEYDLIDSIPFGWGIFGTINRYIFNPFFNFLAGLMPFGIAIIVMTFVVRIVLSPVTYKSYVSQAKMKVIQPEVKEINEKFANNAMKKQQETMKLYNLAGVNPMSGCVPALLQLPVFYALFSFFPTSFILRQKSFLWVDDLSSYDTIIDLPFTIPFYGDHISLFPILASVAIFFYMQMTTGQTMQMQQQPGMPNMKFIMYLSPVMMLFFFNNYASGLSLYYFVSNLLTILIMLVIKNYIIDENRIHLQVQANRQKPAKEGKFQRKMREMMEQAEQQKKLK
ncbi:MAG: membrane protein insertase YidC [Bacteroidetes bacterium]|nr:membrane protein insertase YidC [Bacteroidota bacterium]